MGFFSAIYPVFNSFTASYDQVLLSTFTILLLPSRGFLLSLFSPYYYYLLFYYYYIVLLLLLFSIKFYCTILLHKMLQQRECQMKMEFLH